MISNLKLSYSPVKQGMSMQTKLNDSLVPKHRRDNSSESSSPEG